ncbi:MAG: squalene synthase [Chitinophagales bacterium]|nr:squalene synthase [Chitinophagales bacterium]MDW8273460.1 squalene synthase [Chitinophagales bacterium]
MMKNFPHSFKELKALVSVLKNSPKACDLNEAAANMADMEYCFAALNKVSRSFAVVIQNLPTELRNPVCIFYLTLRGLDTVEDDMNIELQKKILLLNNFYKNCGNEYFSLENIGDTDDYRNLLRHYYKVARAFNRLDKKYQWVISDVCRQMGEGMAKFAEKKLHTQEDYDNYCHYVAGLVGYGLSGLFSASGLEDERLQYQYQLSNSMGLMLQKTNIIRDYHEDLKQKRIFWFTEAWKPYAEHIDWFSLNATHTSSLNCLNGLVADALRHLPDCITYLKLLKQKEVFRFCAIPQVMAIHTLAEVYNNPKVFTSVVKIRKPLAAAMMVYTNQMKDATDYINHALLKIEQKAKQDLLHGKNIQSLVEKARTQLSDTKTYIWQEAPAVEQTVLF